MTTRYRKDKALDYKYSSLKPPLFKYWAFFLVLLCLCLVTWYLSRS